MFRRQRASCSAIGLVALGYVALGCGASTPPPAAPVEAAPEGAAAATDGTEEATSEAPGSGSSEAATSSEATSREASPAEASSAAGSASGAAGPSPKHSDARGREQIQAVMAANRDQVRACYDAALTKNPGIHGDLVIDFVIDPRGNVKQAEVNWSASEIHVPELDTCAADAVRSVKFPPSSRGMESKVSYPFNFNPPRTEPPPKSSAR